MTTFAPVQLRTPAGPRWQTTNDDGEVKATSRCPNPDEAIEVIKQVIDYLVVVDGKKTRLAALLGCPQQTIFRWLNGQYTPSARYLTEILGHVLSQAISQHSADRSYIETLEQRLNKVSAA